MKTKNLRIALVDDHKLFRSGIAMLINSFPEYEVQFEASNGNEFCKKVNALDKPDIVLLDLSMPIMDGMETSMWIKKNMPEINVVVLSMYQDEDKVVQLACSGIKGYILKDSEPQEFKKALDTVASGEIYFPFFVTKHLMGSFSKTKEPRIVLSNREIDFMKLITTELTYRQIADKMGISLRTVETHRENLFFKLNLKSRTGLVLYAIKNKLIEL